MDLCEAIEIICNDYCKYPDIESGNKLADICDRCPMNKCEELRWADRKTEPTISKMEQVEDEPKTQNSNLTFEKDECAKEYEELGLKELKELIEADRKTEPQTYVINPQEPTNDDKCFECEDFFTCDGQCDKIEDEPQTEEWYTYQDEQEYNARHGKE